jgi:hypothetical protein
VVVKFYRSIKLISSKKYEIEASMTRESSIILCVYFKLFLILYQNMIKIIENAMRHYALDPQNFEIKTIGSGLIHQTYILKGEKSYVLQKLNTNVFKEPKLIEKNISLVSNYLKHAQPNYLFPSSIPTIENESLFYDMESFWRLSLFVTNSITIDLVDDPVLAYEAAKAFGQLSKYLNKISLDQFEETIPNFHNLEFRYEQFETSLKKGLPERAKKGKEIIQFFETQKGILETFRQIKKNGQIPLRVQHHDTKISNVLLDSSTKKALAICDLDTLMPGYFISDLGDMVRTYTSSENEESTKWESVKVREPYFKALMQGYLSEMGHSLTSDEKKHIFYAGEFMIYMQGLRFLTDYLLGDIYYPVKHDTHNLNRAKNQMLLLEDLQVQKEKLMDF